MTDFNKFNHNLKLLDYEKNGDFIKQTIDEMIKTIRNDHLIMSRMAKNAETDLVKQARQETKLAKEEIDKLDKKLTYGMNAEEVETAFKFYHNHLCNSVNSDEYAVNISNLMLVHVPTWEVKYTPIGIIRQLYCSCGRIIFDRSEGF